MDAQEKWYSVKEVAARFGVSCDTIRRLIKRGKLRALKLSTQSSKRKRIYEVFRIALTELLRFERVSMTC
jgi:excisionase family DNA binding protein